MKSSKLIFTILFVIGFIVASFAQVDPNTGLNRNQRSKPNTGLFGVGKKASNRNLTISMNKSLDYGVFQDSTDANGDFIISHKLGTDNFAVSAISSDTLPYIFMVTAKTRTTVTIKVVSVADGVFAPVPNAPVKVDWFIRRFVIVDDIEGV